MPRFLNPRGTYVWIPGVYSIINLISSLPASLPDFMIPVIIGQAEEAAVPYTFASTKEAGEESAFIFQYMSNAAAAKDAFGDDSDIAVAMKYAKRHGLPGAYCIAGNALTRASVIATSTGPVVQGTFYAKRYGPAGGHIKIAAVSGTTFTVTGIKRYSLLTANAASGASRLYLKDTSWIVEGDTLYIGDNDSTDAAYVVATKGSELTTTGQINYYITLTTTLAAAIATAQYGMVFTYDTDNAEAPAAFASVQEAVDYFNGTTSKLLGFTVATATFTNPASFIAIATATPLKEIAGWSTATAGTAPAIASGDHTAIVALFQSTAWDAFCIATGVIPQQFLILDSSTTAHTTWRDWAIDKRADETPGARPVGIMAGVAWGDTSTTATNSTSPNWRAGQLNHQDVAVVANGMDKIAAYLSHAPAIFGLMIGGGVKHNLTNDQYQGAPQWEIAWDERTLEQLTTLTKKGVITNKFSSGGNFNKWVVSAGVATLQNNNAAYTGDSPATTCLLQQRHFCDFINAAYTAVLEGTQVGGDGITRDSISAVLVSLGANLLKQGYVSETPTISSITLDDTGAGWNVVVACKPPVTADFIGLTLNILVGE